MTDWNSLPNRWPDLRLLVNCREEKHHLCPEWHKDSKGVKVQGCTCECHSEADENEESEGDE